MTLAENRITSLESRMNEAERQINLLWAEVRKLWDKLGDTEDRVSALEDKMSDVEDEIDEIKDSFGTETTSGGGTVVRLADMIVQWGYVPFDGRFSDRTPALINFPQPFSTEVAYVGGTINVTNPGISNEINYMLWKNDLNSFWFVGDDDALSNAGMWAFAIGF